LGQYLNKPPQEITFIYNDHGKPSTKGNIHFNMSHSKDLALFAFSNNTIGVDIEYIKPKIEYEDIAKRFFSDYEYKAIMQTPAENRKQAFFNCWTRKEAFIKAIGEGLSFPLKDFDVEINDDNESLLLNIRSDKYNSQDWSLFNLNIDSHYKAAVANRGYPSIVNFNVGNLKASPNIY
jgi:4'-phosphopantetheinyl transferase